MDLTKTLVVSFFLTSYALDMETWNQVVFLSITQTTMGRGSSGVVSNQHLGQSLNSCVIVNREHSLDMEDWNQVAYHGNVKTSLV